MQAYTHVSEEYTATCIDNILLLWPDGMNTISELLRLSEIGQLRLHPDHVAVGRIGNRTVNSGLASSLVSVVTLAGPRSLPVEEDIYTCQALSNGTCLSVALSLALLVEFVDKPLLVYVNSSIDGVRHSLVEEFQIRLLGPRIFNGLELCATFSCLFGSVHKLAQRLESGICYTQDVVVVAWVNG
jgi:hypothetical protein